LVNTMHSLCHENTVIYMSYEERKTDLKIELEKKFFKLLDGLFSTERISRDLQDPLYNSDDIHILKMSLLKRWWQVLRICRWKDFREYNISYFQVLGELFFRLIVIVLANLSVQKIFSLNLNPGNDVHDQSW